MYKGLIEPHFNYCSAVWDGLNQQLSEKLQKLQNPAVRVITKSSYDTISRFLLNSLGWDNLSIRRAKQKANLMYKYIHNLAPAYLCNLFAPRTPDYCFCNEKKKLILPKPRTDYLKCSFSYSGTLLWNNLPEEIYPTILTRHLSQHTKNFTQLKQHYLEYKMTSCVLWIKASRSYHSYWTFLQHLAWWIMQY